MIKCYKCGYTHYKLNDFDNVRHLGISLVGNCSNCGSKNNIGSLFKVQKRTVLNSRGEYITYERTNDKLVKV